MMLYSFSSYFALLATLGPVSATSPAVALKPYAPKIMSLKQQILSRNPDHRVEPSNKLHATEELKDTQHLRALRMKDNFYSYAIYSDPGCVNKVEEHNNILNVCVNEILLDTGEERSRISKINKKEFTLVELYYEGPGCRGVPVKVETLSRYFPEFTDYGTCFFSSAFQTYVIVDYKTTWPLSPANTGSDNVGMWYEESAEGLDCKQHENILAAYYVGEWTDFMKCRSEEAGTSFHLGCNADGSVDQVFYPSSVDCSGESGIYSASALCELDDPDEKDEFTTYKKMESVFCVPPKP
mmetsp:Transcript_84508/g.182139  ORF Transcript_84508/g.182139 Transcript_84508/m.182139 type:complete len:296 (+) Transcript_84508:5-892(+)